MTTNSGGLTGWFHRKHDDDAQTDKAENEARTASGGSDQEPVVVWEAANNMEAQIIKGRLESEDIPAIIRGEALGTIYGLTTGNLAVTEVLVPAPLADKAIEILNADADAEDADAGTDDDAPTNDEAQSSH